MNDTAYNAYEARRLAAALHAIETAPLPERKEAAREYAVALREYPKAIGRAVDFILSGNFGHGAYIAAWDIMKHKRMNQVAALGQLAAALEWRCSSTMARRAWRNLTPAEQGTVDAIVQGEIDAALEARKVDAEAEG